MGYKEKEGVAQEKVIEISQENIEEIILLEIGIPEEEDLIKINQEVLIKDQALGVV